MDNQPDNLTKPQDTNTQSPKVPPASTVVINPQTAPEQAVGSKKSKRKIIYIGLGIILMAEIIGGAYYLTRPTSKPQVVTTSPVVSLSPKPVEARATITLNGPSQVKVGQTFKVDVLIATTSPTDGTDLILKYDPKVLEVVPQLIGGKKVSVAVGSTYQDYPANSNDSTEGVVTLSGVTSVATKGFSGNGGLGSVTFKAKLAQSTTVSVQFDKGLTTDSNVIESKTGKDILSQVNNLSINILK